MPVMTILKLGDRGPAVADLQERLNLKPSRLVRLKVDGMFGSKTHARVLEFQKDNALKMDGLVGEKTEERLPAKFELFDLEAFILEMAYLLDPLYQPEFFMKAQIIKAETLQPLLNNPNLLGTTVAENLAVLAALFIVMLFLAILASQSRNPAHRKSGEAWSRKREELKDRSRAGATAELEQNSLFETRKMGREVQTRAQAERDKCEENLKQNNPQKLKDCEKLFQELSKAIQNLIQKLNAPGGVRGRNNVIVAKGISEAVKAVWAAERALGDCTGCDNMW